MLMSRKRKQDYFSLEAFTHAAPHAFSHPTPQGQRLPGDSNKELLVITAVRTLLEPRGIPLPGLLQPPVRFYRPTPLLVRKTSLGVLLGSRRHFSVDSIRRGLGTSGIRITTPSFFSLKESLR